MRKVFQILAIVLILGLLAGLAQWIIHPPEPVYQGQTASFWLDETLQSGVPHNALTPDWRVLEADRAIRAMGTNIIPVLLERIKVRNSASRWTLIGLKKKYDWLPLSIMTQPELQLTACKGFEDLGPVAQPAVPALIQLLEEKDANVRGAAAACLGHIGPEAREAVPALIKYLDACLKQNSGSPQDCYRLGAAAFTLGEIGPAARAAIPQITVLSTLTSTFSDAQAFGLAALIKIKADPQLLVTEVIKDPSDKSNWVKKGNVIYLLGTNAEPAIPFLLTVLQGSNTFFQPRALQLLGRIHARADICLPVVTDLLQSTNGQVRYAALECMREFGGFKQCLPLAQIENYLHSRDLLLRKAAREAVNEITREKNEKSHAE